MQLNSPYHLIQEMIETPEIMRRFKFDDTRQLGKVIADQGRLFITGEGSSRIFPAKNMMDHALKNRTNWQIFTHGARQAADYDLSSFVILSASNSGKTREVIELYQNVQACSKIAVTAANNSPLEASADHTVVLKCGAENAVAATKSVIEQALVYQSLLPGQPWQNLDKAADAAESILNADVPGDILSCIKNARHIYFAGREDGVAEELTLKTNEIIRKESSFLEGTYALHGIEEVMRPDDLIVLVDPFAAEIDAYEKVLRQGADVQVIAISDQNTLFPTFKIPTVKNFNNYLQLVAGWNILASAGLEMEINIDKPARARKVGNSIEV